MSQDSMSAGITPSFTMKDNEAFGCFGVVFCIGLALGTLGSMGFMSAIDKAKVQTTPKITEPLKAGDMVRHKLNHSRKGVVLWLNENKVSACVEYTDDNANCFLANDTMLVEWDRQ